MYMKSWLIGIVVFGIVFVIVFFAFFKIGLEQDLIPTTQTNEGENTDMNQENFKISININDTLFTATLENNETTKEFIRRLPLHVEMQELNGNEKYYYFEEDLPSNSSRVGRIEKGDIMLYGTDCLVIFYESFSTPYSYTRIGKIANPDGLENILGSGSIQVSISE